MTSSPHETLVVIGAGIAGLRAAEGARQAGFAGRIILVSDETHQPYDRPPLSKAVLLGEADVQNIGLCEAGALDEHEIEFEAGRPVTAIDRAARKLTLANGETIAYDVLVLATGSRVRTLEALPPSMPRVFYLRTLDDAMAFRAQLAQVERVAVVGGGVIGLEVAAAANKEGRRVTVIEAGDRVMARTSCAIVSDYFEQRHRGADVEFLFGVTVERAEPALNGAVTLVLSGGAVIEVDLVAVGVGVQPNVDLARACGLEVSRDGVVVDGLGRSSDPAIFAAGEVAFHFNALSGRHERQETWAHAAAHGDHVGRSIVAPGADYAEIGSYWTDQYDINLQSVGVSMGEADLVRGDIGSGKFVVFHVAGDRIIGVTAVNAVRELRAAKKLIGRPANAQGLTDPATPLKELVASLT
jgi:3-phenylpropionate/trans-cinnamate dioxygenase ferredoxin reductase subunit